MIKKFLKRFFLTILFTIIIAGCLFTHFYAPRFITEIQNPVIGFLKPEYQDRKVPDFESVLLNGGYPSKVAKLLRRMYPSATLGVRLYRTPSVTVRRCGRGVV